MSLSERLSPYQPSALAMLRLITAILFIEHGSQKLFGFPPAPYAITTLFFVAGVLELVGGILVLLGLFTRPVAFLLSGEMAIAYFTVHMPINFFPANNQGDGAILFCFIFLFMVFSGPGDWALDNRQRR
ncbi:DoxX family membrane protein [Rhizobium lusitanum]|uniref:DoxX family membrane protein n=1 Tax=Rhizobium lusitanum TaxID=293958 RepID=A0A6L9UG30_9HYPH|nr:DoxX family protein [Rhizobium lusitanum]NEI73096.1 DoxX family membrane protein [Rhizobium lusitanum]